MPTLAETLPGLEFNTWVGVWGPAGLPDALVARLHGTFQAVTAEPALAQMLHGTAPSPSPRRRRRSPPWWSARPGPRCNRSRATTSGSTERCYLGIVGIG
ncbi:MAG: hypothetical protein ACO1PM_21615 [Acidovorax sp.]